MSVRYERVKNPKKSAVAQADTPASDKKGSKGPKKVGENGAPPSILKKKPVYLPANVWLCHSKTS